MYKMLVVARLGFKTLLMRLKAHILYERRGNVCAHIDMVRSCEHKCECLDNNVAIITHLWNVLPHIFSPFDIQHTKSPKNPPYMYALDRHGPDSEAP